MSDEPDPIGWEAWDCETCLFRSPGWFCHRMPPVVMDRLLGGESCEPYSRWPDVDPGDWCGEYRPRPAPNEPPRQGG